MLSRLLYKCYAGFYTFRLWRKRHFTPTGVMIVTAFFLAGILGSNILKSTLYQVMAFCGSLMAASVCLNLFSFKFKVRVNRTLPEFATAGEKVIYRIEITNKSSKTQKGLILYEDITDPRPDLQTLLAKKEPFENLRNVWDRKTLYYRWMWLIRKAEKAQFHPIELPDLPVNETIIVTSTIVPQYRGIIHFSGVTFARPDTIGLFTRVLRVEKAQKLLVLPKRYQLDSPELMASRQYQPGGISLSSSIGDSDEFMALRYYRPGDPMRNIHWRTFAKTNELVIKEFEDEYFIRHALILDTFLSSDNDMLFEAAVSIASSYISSLQVNDSILDLMFVGHTIYSFPSGRGLAGSDKMLEILACVETCENKTILELVPVLQSNIKKISGSICIFLGWQNGHKKVFQLFQKAQVPVFIIVLAADKLKMEQKIFRDINSTTSIKVVSVSQIEKDLSQVQKEESQIKYKFDPVQDKCPRAQKTSDLK